MRHYPLHNHSNEADKIKSLWNGKTFFDLNSDKVYDITAGFLQFILLIISN